MSNANSMALNGDTTAARSSAPRVLLRLPDLNVQPKVAAKTEPSPEATLFEKSPFEKFAVEKSAADKTALAEKSVTAKVVASVSAPEKLVMEKSAAATVTLVRSESAFSQFAGWIKKGSAWLGDEPAWLKLIEAGHTFVLSRWVWMGGGIAATAIVGGMYLMGPGAPTASDADTQTPLVEWQPPLPFAPGETSPLPLRTAPESAPALSNVAESPVAPSLVGDRYPSDPLATQTSANDWQLPTAPLARNGLPRQPGVARLEGIIIDTVPTTAEARHEPNRPGLH